MRTPELLAPAGTIEIARSAFNFGADAVYLGGSMLQLRAASAGFTDSELEQTIKEAHALNRKVYVTVNAYLREGEEEKLVPYAKKLRDMGADGAIISDIGIIRLFGECAKGLDVHVSTQTNVMSAETAKVYHALGAKRVVPARELTLKELAEMRKKLPADMEMETFIHGAMCMAYSGRCMLSAFLTGRSGNRGGCAQPCRWIYHVVEEKRPGMIMDVEESENGMAVFSSRDLRAMEFLDKLVDAGIDSFKIEGRMKTEYYVSTVVGAYRKRLDMILEGRRADFGVLMDELNAVSHRPYSSGFYFNELVDMPGDGGGYEYDCMYVAKVEEAFDGGCVVTIKNKLYAGEELEVVSPDSAGKKYTAAEISDCDGNVLSSADVPAARYNLYSDVPLRKGDLLRRRIR